MRPQSGFEMAEKSEKKTLMSQFADITSSPFFDTAVTLHCLVKFSYWSKFHVNIMTGSGVMAIFVYKGLTRNPEIGKAPV